MTVAIVLLCLVAAGLQVSHSAKIVGYPMFGGSQYIGMKRIAQELASRGHEVTLLVGSSQKIKPSKEIKHVIYKVPFDKDYLEKEVVKKVVKGGIKDILFSGSKGMPAILKTYCEATLNATHLLEPMKEFDLLIADCSAFCGPILAEYLNITRLDYCPGPPRMPFSYYYHGPSYASYVPQIMSKNPSNMNFLQRVKNTLVYVAGLTATRFIFIRSFDEVKTRYNINPEKSYADAIGDAEMVLYLADFVLDFPFPLLPGHKMIGPINIHPPRALTPEFQEMIDDSDGAIIVSFGSNVASILEKDEVDMMADAFGRLKEKVFWRLKGYIPANMSPNIKIVEWMPQNDLLANDKMRAFVSHVGQNSYYESTYHGVPLVAVPLFGDQPDNGAAAEEKGLGLNVDIHTITADQFYKVIRRVIDEPSFKANSQRLSRLMKDRPRTPAQEAGDWVEYTLRHGRLTHLRPASVHLAWYQYFLLDVMLFLVTVLVAFAMVIRLIWKCMCGLCCRRAKKTKVQ